MCVFFLMTLDKSRMRSKMTESPLWFTADLWRALTTWLNKDRPANVFPGPGLQTGEFKQKKYILLKDICWRPFGGLHILTSKLVRVVCTNGVEEREEETCRESVSVRLLHWKTVLFLCHDTHTHTHIHTVRKLLRLSIVMWANPHTVT